MGNQRPCSCLLGNEVQANFVHVSEYEPPQPVALMVDAGGDMPLALTSKTNDGMICENEQVEIEAPLASEIHD